MTGSIVNITQWYLAICHDCAPVLPQPFSDPAERDEWARQHQDGTGHNVERQVELRRTTRATRADTVSDTECRVCWGSHQCHLPVRHDGDHQCGRPDDPCETCPRTGPMGLDLLRYDGEFCDVCGPIERAPHINAVLDHAMRAHPKRWAEEYADDYQNYLGDGQWGEHQPPRVEARNRHLPGHRPDQPKGRSMTLVEFLTARWIEIEAGSEGAGLVAWLTYRDPDGQMRYTTVAAATVEAPDYWVVDGRDARETAHVKVVYDEREVRADISAKRAILELHALVHRNIGWAEDADTEYEELPVCGLCVPKHSHFPSRPAVPIGGCLTLRLLALPFAAHPDYDESWRP